MSDPFKEQRPLLCEDISDDELKFSPQRRHMGLRGRARNNIKGAAAIIKAWPDHWTSSLTTWWISIGMFVATVFIIYNLFIFFTMLPKSHMMPLITPESKNIAVTSQNLRLPDIFMHVVVRNEREADLSKLLPYIEIYADKYLDYKFNLIMLFNDIHLNENANRRNEINNEDALNLLWTDNSINEPIKKKSNINVQYTNLSSYLKSSPVFKYWKQIPDELIDFFLRAISIWDKGGIAFSPMILTPKSPHPIYIEKLQSILDTYQKGPKLNNSFTEFHNNSVKQEIISSHKSNSRKTVNNIRDIIEALSADTESDRQSQSLSAAENKEQLTAVEIKPFLDEFVDTHNDDRKNFTAHRKIREDFTLSNPDEPKARNQTSLSFINGSLQKNTTMKSHFPMLLSFLFHDYSKEVVHHNDVIHETAKDHILKRSPRANMTEFRLNKDQDPDKVLPMIVPPPANFDKLIKTKKVDMEKGYEEEDKLTIDLNGILLSTRISCHAFIGSVFSDVKHCSNDQSLKDFIISELSRFCKGLISNCKGIEVVLI